MLIMMLMKLILNSFFDFIAIGASFVGPYSCYRATEINELIYRTPKAGDLKGARRRRFRSRKMNSTGQATGIRCFRNFFYIFLLQDPVSHRIIEKRRRDRMNNCLAELSNLLPARYLNKVSFHLLPSELLSKIHGAKFYTKSE